MIDSLKLQIRKKQSHFPNAWVLDSRNNSISKDGISIPLIDGAKFVYKATSEGLRRLSEISFRIPRFDEGRHTAIGQLQFDRQLFQLTGIDHSSIWGKDDLISDVRLTFGPVVAEERGIPSHATMEIFGVPGKLKVGGSYQLFTGSMKLKDR